MKRFTVIFIFTGLSVLSKAQYSEIQLTQFLTNNSNRQWQLSEYKKTLGSDCLGDWQLYTFFNDGKAVRRRCTNDTVETIDFKWALKPVGLPSNNEWQIQFSQSLPMNSHEGLMNMRIDMPLPAIRKKGKKMTWREFPGCKGCPSAQLTLTSTN